ncbi:MAG: hypothetical protein ACE5NM_03825 [Sedimentisphaerales bacterium]
MLSFLREQGAEKLSAQSPVDAPGRTDSEALENAPGQGSRGAGSQQYLTVAAQNKNVRKSTIMVAVLFGIGLLCLWFMIKKSAPQTASASSTDTQETQIEAAIARLTGVSSELFNRMDQIVNKFYEFSNVLQVQVNELVKNPFELEMFLSSLKGKVDAQQEDIDINAELIRQQQIRQKASSLSLLTICQTEQGNCCMIDDKILYEGDLINGFKVTQIGDNFVKIKWQDSKDDTAHSETPSPGPEIILKLSE